MELKQPYSQVRLVERVCELLETKNVQGHSEYDLMVIHDEIDYILTELNYVSNNITELYEKNYTTLVK